MAAPPEMEGSLYFSDAERMGAVLNQLCHCKEVAVVVVASSAVGAGGSKHAVSETTSAPSAPGDPQRESGSALDNRERERRSLNAGIWWNSGFAC